MFNQCYVAKQVIINVNKYCHPLISPMFLLVVIILVNLIHKVTSEGDIIITITIINTTILTIRLHQREML